MGAGLIWATIIGSLATVGLISLLVWVMIRFPERVSHGRGMPAYMRRAEVSVLPRRREAPEYGAPEKAAA